MGNAWGGNNKNLKMGHWREIKFNKDELAIGGRNSSVAVVGTNIYRFGNEEDLNYNDLFVFDAKSLKWSAIYPRKGVKPKYRMFHTICAVNKSIYLFGGYDPHANQDLNDFYKFDIERNCWEKIEAENGPGARFEHTMSVIHDNFIVIFGGGCSALGPNSLLNDIHVFNIQENEWMRNFWVTGSKPSRRLSHSACVYNNMVIIFGGCDENHVRLNDLHLFSFQKTNGGEFGNWIQPIIKGKIKGRAGHSAVISGDEMIIFGGNCGGFIRMNDLQLINLISFEVKSIEVKSEINPCGRSYHSTSVIGNRFYLFGGLRLFDAWLFDIQYICEKSLPVSTTTEDVAKEYKQLVNQKAFSDIEFVMSDGTIFYAHKVILSLRSSHFNAMFNSGLLEANLSSVSIPSVDPPIFLQLLEYIYSGTVVINATNVCDLLEVADRFTEEKLKLQCEEFLRYHISPDNVCSLLALADQFSALHLKNGLINFVISNYDSLHSTKEYQELPANIKEEVNKLI